MNGKILNIAKVGSGFALATLLAVILYKVIISYTNDFSHSLEKNAEAMGGMQLEINSLTTQINEERKDRERQIKDLIEEVKRTNQILMEKL